MVVYPNCKINLGLNIIAKRDDGFHTIETVFYPISLCDILEAIPNEQFTEVNMSGIVLDSNGTDNLVLKAYCLLKKDFSLFPLSFYLHKQIPSGAGLGGGSADAAFAIKLINQLCKLRLSDDQQIQYAKQLGSDCAFFIKNKPVFATGKGDEFHDIQLSLKGFTVLLIKPTIHISTAEAFAGVIPDANQLSPKEIISLPVPSWKNKLNNQFETTVFAKCPLIKDIKNWMYDHGAIYASMSGSGSTVFGLFTQACTAKPDFLNDYFIFSSLLD